MAIQIKQKPCKGNGRAKGHGCGLIGYHVRYGLNKCCYQDWLFNSNEGQISRDKSRIKAKPPVNYKEGYCEHFGLTAEDFIYEEFEYIINNKRVKANKIHHILHGSHKYDHIDNWMALSTTNHDKAHDEQFDRYYLKDIHLQFLENNPY